MGNFKKAHRIFILIKSGVLASVMLKNEMSPSAPSLSSAENRLLPVVARKPRQIQAIATDRCLAVLLCCSKMSELITSVSPRSHSPFTEPGATPSPARCSRAVRADRGTCTELHRNAASSAVVVSPERQTSLNPIVRT